MGILFDWRCFLGYDMTTMSHGRLLLVFLLSGCVATSGWHAQNDFTYVPISTDDYEIATWQKISDSRGPVHIYIEGDGHAFNGRGTPTSDPTPRGTLVRDLAASDSAPNVVYIARPCQYIMSASCTRSDWTDGRFSSRVIKSVADTIRTVAGARPIVLVGYSGGAMVSGLVIQNYPDLNVKQWITIAGVLNHSDWTEYFGDSPLTQSMSLNKLPNLPQTHYVAEKDKTVPTALSVRWTGGANIVIVPNATHDNLKNLKIDFIY